MKSKYQVHNQVHNDSILVTKLVVPKSHDRLIKRNRFLSASQLPALTFIQAPAGYGKSVLMSSWANSQELPVAWLSLDYADNDAVRFLLYLIAAIGTIFPSFGEAISDALQSSQQLPTSAAIHLIINQICRLPNTFLLILDDYHVINKPSIHQAVGDLIGEQPPQLKLVIGSRECLGISLARIRAQGQLLEYNAQDLRFTLEETQRFLQQGMALDLDAEEINLLNNRTEGWAVGLQLASLSLRNHPDRSVFIKDFSGNNEHISEFLIEEVLRRQPEEIQNFLLATSILERFCADLCDYVTERANSRMLITVLEKAGLFLVQLDSNSVWYRYHHLFASLLAHRLSNLQPKLISELHRRASQWYRDNGLPTEAIIHALAARDYELAADLLERNGYQLFSHGWTHTILQWAKMLPSEMLQHRPALSLACAWSRFFTGDLAGAEQYLRYSEDSITRRGKTSYTDQEKGMIGQIALLGSCLMRYRGNSEKAMELTNKALQFFTPGKVLHDGALACQAICHFVQGEVKQAIATFSTVINIHEGQRNLLVPMTAVLGLGRSYVANGRLHGAEFVYERALKQCIECGWEALPITGMLHIGIGEVAYERNDLLRAEQQLALGVKMTSNGMQFISDWGTILLEQTRLALGKSDKDFAQKQEKPLLKYLDQSIIDTQRPSINLIRLWLLQGRYQAVGSWVETKQFDIKKIDPKFEPEYLMFVRWLFSEQRFLEVQKWANLLLPGAKSGERTRAVIEILILRSLAEQGMMQIDEALGTIEYALQLAAPEQYARIFIDEGAPLGGLLQRLILSGRENDYALYLLGQLRSLPSATPSPKFSLSTKERQVAQYIIQEYSNQEIANTLFVSLNTVKTHLKNIYRKLGARNRKEAILQLSLEARF